MQFGTGYLDSPDLSLFVHWLILFFFFFFFIILLSLIFQQIFLENFSSVLCRVENFRASLAQVKIHPVWNVQSGKYN